jgi:hypothetical protein
MPPLNTYLKQREYFVGNRVNSEKRFAADHERYTLLYDQVLTRSHTKGRRQAVSIALLLRAAVYINTSHDTALQGHIEEARFILRSPIELTLLAFLVFHSDPVWALWQECHDLRLKNTDDKGKVDVPNFTDTRFNVNTIVKSFGAPFDSIPLFANLKRFRGESSTYWGHQNLYNVVPRIEDLHGEIRLYIGQDASSENDRMKQILTLTTDLISMINDLSKEVAA